MKKNNVLMTAGCMMMFFRGLDQIQVVNLLDDEELYLLDDMTRNVQEELYCYEWTCFNS